MDVTLNVNENFTSNKAPKYSDQKSYWYKLANTYGGEKDSCWALNGQSNYSGRLPKMRGERERDWFILTSRHFGHGMWLYTIAISSLETVSIMHAAF